jgi:general secretion pathway protein J
LKISRAILRPRPSRGFTLIEIMVAIAIFMMVIMAIYSTWAMVMRATQVGQAAAARSQRERVALNTLENSLMCIQSFQSSQRYYSFNVVSGDAPALSFASRLPDVFPRNGKFPDHNLRRITYSLEPAAGGSKDLVLRQNPILMDMDDDEQKTPLVLAHNVKTFLVECWDTNQLDWVTEWDNTNAIPPMLKVTLDFGGNTAGDKTAPDTFVVRSFSMPSAEMPSVVQGGIPGGGPPAGGFFRRPGQ